MSTPIYNDNATPFGGRSQHVFRKDDAGVYQDIGVYEFEALDIKRNSTVGEKHDAIGRAKGWWSVPGFATGTGTVQIPGTASVVSQTGAVDGLHLQNGDAFCDDFGFGPELWIILDTSDPFQQKEYRKQTLTIRLSANPPEAAALVVTAVVGANLLGYQIS